MRDELAHESVVVLESDDALILIPGSRLRELDLLSDQSFDPEADRAGKYRERGDSYLASTLSSSPRIRPGEESENAPWVSLLITEVEVIGGRVVEVYGTLDEPEPEDAGVEIEIPLGIARDTGDVVNTGSAEAHRVDSCLASFRGLRGYGALFPLSPVWHNISNSYPSIEATDMPFAEALM